MKTLGKSANLASVSDKKRFINKHHLNEAHKVNNVYLFYQYIVKSVFTVMNLLYRCCWRKQE